MAGSAKRPLILTALVVIVTLGSLPASGESPDQLTVSPGAVDRFTGVEVRCPTFSWQAVPRAVGYEVVVYELPQEIDLAGWSLDEATEVLFVELPLGVTAWTPPFERGLARGADHVWFVRGVVGDGSANATPWSRARFFRVVGSVSQPGPGFVTLERSGNSRTESGTGSGSIEARSEIKEIEAGRYSMAKRVGEKNTTDVGTAMAAIRGEMPDATGETYGIVGTSNSMDGAGLGAVNTAGGPDLVLDGVANGDLDTMITQAGIDRASSETQSFLFTNSGAGALDVYVEGQLLADSFHGDGTNVTSVDADLLDGHPSAHYAMTGDLASPGGPSVHWDNLTVVPSGLDDGDDDTRYEAGAGLTGGSPVGDATLSIAAGGVTTEMIQDASVTEAKLSPAGGYEGQVLKHTGSAAEWSLDRLHLPYSGWVSSFVSDRYAFSINCDGLDADGAIYAGTAYGDAIYGWTTEDIYSRGVFGRNDATQGYLGGEHGAYGQHHSTFNSGELGTEDWGALGQQGDDSSLGYLGGNSGVYGRCTVGGGRMAGYFNGPVHVNGNLSKAGGSFRIDHPLDPENRYLSHSFVESPDMMNVYNGNVVTDADGYAVVTLPEWFEALNRDFRYQLTVIGQFAQAIVDREIEDGRFVIRTNLSNVKVSWQITGIRQDRWANAHRIQVEEDKADAERGTYLAPELWGQTKELGLAWRQEARIRDNR